MSGIGRIPVEAFKKGIFQIMQTDVMQAVLADFRLGFGLKYDGGQLFMITNENKLTNSISTRHITRTKKPQQLWFQYLSSLIHNSHIESFQTEQFRFGGECGDSAHKNTATLYAGMHLTT